MDHAQWKGTTGGTTWMHRLLTATLRVLPLWMVYVAMAVLVVPGYMLFSRQGYLSAYHFFRRHLRQSVPRAFANVYRNHVKFGQVIIDRFYVYAGGRFHFDMDNYDLYLRLSAEPSGFVVLSAHVGNYELAGYTLQAQHKHLYALVFSGEMATVMRNRTRLFAGNNIEMVPVADDMSHLFTLSNALADGNIVSIPGDRVLGSKRTVPCAFLGQDAPFPLGPFVLATQRPVPVLAVWVMKTGLKRYRIHIEQLSVDDQEPTARRRAAALAAAYAGRLESIVRRYPTQWFNYYEFWNKPEDNGRHKI